MPYCTIEEAWGIQPSNDSPINPKVGTNTLNENDKTSRNYSKLIKSNGTNRYLKNKDKLEFNLEEQPIVKPNTEEGTSYSLCNRLVDAEEQFEVKQYTKPQENTVGNTVGNTIGNTVGNTIGNTVGNNTKKTVENFDIDKLIDENNYLKSLLNNKKDNNNNQELILFIVLGIFLIYIFNLFVRIGNK